MLCHTFPSYSGLVLEQQILVARHKQFVIKKPVTVHINIPLIQPSKNERHGCTFLFRDLLFKAPLRLQFSFDLVAWQVEA